MREERADAVITGAGLAGLACAIAACEHGTIRPVLLERGPKAGRKLLVSGDGQCNITNDQPLATFFEHYGAMGQSRFVRSVLQEYPNTALITRLARGGIPLEHEAGGKIFPASRKSRDILQFFENRAKQNGTSLRTSSEVRAVRKLDDGFEIETDTVRYLSRFLVLAAGGCTWPKLGSDGSGFALAKSLGHTIIDPRPALAAVYVNPWPLADCSGMSIDSPRVALIRAGRVIRHWSGPILLTHRGLSGPGILNASRYMTKGDQLTLALLPVSDAGELSNQIRNWSQSNPTAMLKTFFHEQGLPARLTATVLQILNLNGNTTGAELRKEDRATAARGFTAFPVTIAALEGFATAMVTAGGVALDEVNRQTMESRRVPGLYFAGEILDVDGDCGGYNLQFAWSSGSRAGASLAQRKVSS